MKDVPKGPCPFLGKTTHALCSGRLCHCPLMPTALKTPRPWPRVASRECREPLEPQDPIRRSTIHANTNPSVGFESSTRDRYFGNHPQIRCEYYRCRLSAEANEAYRQRKPIAPNSVSSDRQSRDPPPPPLPPPPPPPLAAGAPLIVMVVVATLDTPPR